MKAAAAHQPTPPPPPLDAYAPSTKRSYASIWRQFTAWLATQPGPHDLPLPPETVIAYLQHLADSGRKWSTIESHRALIIKTHRRAGYNALPQDEGLKDRVKNLARQIGKRQTQMQAITSTAQAAIDATAAIPRRTRGGNLESPEAAQARALFDQALVSTMRDALLRCEEAAALLWEDLDPVQDGTGRIMIRSSKTDQSGKGTLLYLSRTSMDTLQALRAQRPQDQRIFPLSKDQLRRRIKSAAKAAGLKGNFGGHSPRIGMAVDLAQSGTGLPEIQNAGRWQSPNMPARYIRGITAGQGAVARYSQQQNR